MTIDGPFSAGLSDQSNSVMAAARLMMPENRGATIHLIKNLPIASGIGGGSADAAAALQLFAKLWSVALPKPDEILKLGADVPVCLAGDPVRMRGIGEQLQKLHKLPKFALVLANSGTPVSTAQIFENFTQTDNSPVQDFESFGTSTALFDFLAAQRNDLQETACQISPEIENVLAALNAAASCRLARMSGSGGTCFGLFDTLSMARAAASVISKQNPEWWVAAALV